jgi:signal transduction histidine kinase
MPIVEQEFAPLRDARMIAQVADYAPRPSPAWLWSADGARIIWANAVGAAIFGAANATERAKRRFDANDVTAAEVVRLARTLPSTGQARLERLRGFGAGFGRALTCACTRATLGDGKPAVLIAATESAGPVLPLHERVRRLFADRGQALAVFAADGTLLYATAAAATHLAGATSLSALGVDPLAAQALAAGSAAGSSRQGAIEIERLGSDASTVLAVSFGGQPDERADVTAASQPADREQPSPPVTPALKPVEPAASAQRGAAREEQSAERRHPLRFVWQMDADGRFVVGSDEFVELVGPRTTAAFGRLWNEIAADLALDPDNQVARAVATRETWSGVVLAWPVDDSSERLPVELSGLPVFDRDRNFRGYRGFGVCRDIARLNQLAHARREHPIGFMPPLAAREDESAVPSRTRARIAEAAASAIAAQVAAATAGAALREERPAADVAPAAVAPAAANVVPFRTGAPAEAKTPSLSPVERRAFRELAQELAARLREAPEAAATIGAAESAASERQPVADKVAEVEIAPGTDTEPLQLLDRVPVGILIYRHDALLYANRHLLRWSGYESREALAEAGGVGALFAESGAGALMETDSASTLSIIASNGQRLPVEAQLYSVPWSGGAALALILTGSEAGAPPGATALALASAEQEIRALKSTLDAAADGALVLDRGARIVAATGGAEALFGRPADALHGRLLGELFTPASDSAVRDYFDRLIHGADAAQTSLPQKGIEVSAHGRGGEIVPLTLTLARLSAERFGAVLRDEAALKKLEEEMRAAKREAQRAAAAKADFLAKVSHEIRTPLNSITGFAEVIVAERFGPIGNDRYREYLKHIHEAGTQLVTLLNDLLDLSKVETGQINLTFGNVSLNELTQQCVGIMQPQASRARIIIRTSLTPGLPQVVADERSLRQIVLNLLSNSIRFTGPGGQVIVSTAFADSGEAVLRVRDTGVGMSEQAVEIALAPFRQTATSGSWDSSGTGLALPLTKALAEANQAHFSIKSAPNAGTLVEVAFPPTRVAR